MGAIEAGFEIGLADELDKLLRSGEWQNRRNIAAEKPPSEESAIAKTAREKFIKNDLFLRFFEADRSYATLGEEARDFVNFFPEAKGKKLLQLQHATTVIGLMATKAIEAVTLRDAHCHAEEQFDFYAREMGRNLLGSTEYKVAEVNALFWGRGADVAKDAVEYSIREGLPY